ncbi:MAG: GntR family transcriptional regulator [Roseburia sp.]|nr:GntR family transcriptional regulator [Roseburia sp.]MCM1098681.1 GntR family transcriptional regulator [Ruminococcus flavefaciens]
MVSFEKLLLGDDGPIYMQIIRFVKQGIASGAIADQEEIPSRRALSALLGVNPNTIQKAYHMLEEEGIIVSRSGAKSYTCVGEGTVERIRGELMTESAAGWVKSMKQLGVDREEAFALAERLWSS